MSKSCAQWRGEIGAYVIGALDGFMRERVACHLAACAGCRADYDELVPVRDWLCLLDSTTGAPEPGAAEQPWHPLVQRLHIMRPRTRHWLLAAAAAGAAAIVAVAALLVSGASIQTFRGHSATGISGNAQLHDTPTGTQIDLTASGLPANERCILVAVTHHGTDIAGSWNATYDGSARIAGTTAFAASQLTALRIESDTGSVLLSIRV